MLKNHENDAFHDGWIDTHCHLADTVFRSDSAETIQNAVAAGVSGILSSALRKEEFDFHLRLNHPRVRWTAGIHPYESSSLPDDFPGIVSLCEGKKIVAIGEIGLDGRNPDMKGQEKLLRTQLDLAMHYNLPVVFHVVRHHNRLFHILRDEFPGIRGVIHGFCSSLEVFRMYRRLGLFVSIGGCMTRDSSHAETLREIIQSGEYLFETDAPDQKPEYIIDEFFEPKHLVAIVTRIAQITETPTTTMKETQMRNFRELFES